MLKWFTRWARAHVVLASVIGAFMLTGTAAAAWFIYTTAFSGSVTSSFGTAPSQAMVTASQGSGGTSVVPCTAGTGATCTGGTMGVMNVTLTNNDPSATHNLTGNPTVTFSVAGHSECNSHLFVVNESHFGDTLTYGTPDTQPQIQYVADPSTPNTCSAGAITATLTGTAQ
ncbi:MAG TPA: hypothetical protein VFB25_10775 [Gaiellaceae bacterium]|nr:hypothetical protein [Gaiellaceae bacterium]